MNNFSVVSQDGEIVNTIYEGDRVVRKNSVDSFVNTDKWEMSNFMKVDLDELQLLLGELTSIEKSFLLSVLPNTSYVDCHLIGKSGKDITIPELMKITGLSKAYLFKVIFSLIKKDLLYRGKNSNNGQYFVNPWVFCKGNRINKVLKTMFQNYFIRSLNKKWKDIR